MSNFFIHFNILLNRFLTLLGLRRQNRRWGIVYDSVSKQPLDPVIVRLVDAKTGRVVQTSVTDLAGRYNFLVYPGKFKILAKKTNYNFPSAVSAGDHDEIYGNLYHGEFFELAGDSEVVPFSIPMDPANPDWNQAAKQPLTNFHPYAENLLYRVVTALFWFALTVILFGLYLRPSRLIYGFLVFYALVLLLAVFLPRPRWWGSVRFKASGAPAAGAAVEISYRHIPGVIVAKAEIYGDGKFFLRLDPGKYTLRIKRTSGHGAAEILRSQKVRVGSERVINRNFAV